MAGMLYVNVVHPKGLDGPEIRPGAFTSSHNATKPLNAESVNENPVVAKGFVPGRKSGANVL